MFEGQIEGLIRAGVGALRAALETRQLSVRELVENVLERAVRLSPPMNPFLSFDVEEAVAAADRLEARRVERLPLFGIPFGLKDNIATRGLRTTAGSRVLERWIPKEDAEVVRRLRDAGGVLIGKLAMSEFAFGATGLHPLSPVLANPWNAERIPGGSSSGPAAAVAAGLLPFALGTDTGGSVRIPAALCGCVGFKPTSGRISLAGIVPQALSLDHVGTLTRNVSDAALVCGVLAPQCGFDAELERPFAGIRIGLPERDYWEELDAEVEVLVRTAVEQLLAEGASSEEVTFEAAPALARAVGTIIAVEAAAYHAKTFASQRADFTTGVAANLEIGQALEPARYQEALELMRQLRNGGADRAFGAAELLALPTVGVPAPRIDEARRSDPTPRLSLNASAFSLTGQPAITLPVGLTSEGLPVGLTLVGRWGEDARVLGAARTLERIQEPAPPPPSIPGG